MGQGSVRTGNYEDRELLGRELRGQGTTGQGIVRTGNYWSGNCEDRNYWAGNCDNSELVVREL